MAGHPTEKVVWWFAALAFLIDLGEEIAADAMDVEGDRLIGSRSLAIVFGPQQALKISALVFLAVVLVSAVPFAFWWLAPVYFVPIGIMDAIIIYSTVQLLRPHSENPRLYIRWIYLSGLFAILVFIVLRLLLS